MRTVIRRAYRNLERHYLAWCRGEAGYDCPPKQNFEFSDDERARSMPCRVKEVVGTKLIWSREASVSGKYDTDAYMLIVERGGRFHIVGDGLYMTQVRTALMSLLAIDLLGVDVRTLGLVGNGRINQLVAQYAKELLGVDSLVIRGSDKNRFKNAGVFRRFAKLVFVDRTDDLALLNTCDAVVCTTDNCDMDARISCDQLYSPQVVVANDLGWILDESWLTCDRFIWSDDSQSLVNHIKSEFPRITTEQFCVRRLQESPAYRSVVLPYGIALADLVVACTLRRIPIEG